MKTVPGKDPWLVVSYEIDMHEQLSKAGSFARLVQNAITESRVLHTRQLCDIFIPDRSNRSDDVSLGHLIPGWEASNNAKCEKLKRLVQHLKQQYGDSRMVYSPCWVFNKKMAHATLERTDNYDYGPALAAVSSTLRAIVAEIESIAGKQFRRMLSVAECPISAETLETS
jgi:hypothetical protein